MWCYCYELASRSIHYHVVGRSKHSQNCFHFLLTNTSKVITNFEKMTEMPVNLFLTNLFPLSGKSPLSVLWELARCGKINTPETRCLNHEHYCFIARVLSVSKCTELITLEDSLEYPGIPRTTKCKQWADPSSCHVCFLPTGRYSIHTYLKYFSFDFCSFQIFAWQKNISD